jgi:sugar lactone lactonase YvrE
VIALPLLCALLVLQARAQSIVTIAGGGPLGDGFAATKAVLNNPSGLGLDKAGNLFIADETNDRVRRVDASSAVISTVAGGGSSTAMDGIPATQGQLMTPRDVAIDPAGNLYIGAFDFDLKTFVVRRVDAKSGIMTRIAGGGVDYGDGGPATAAKLSNVTSIVFDPAGDLVVCDRFSAVRKISLATGIITTLAGGPDRGFSGDGGPATQAKLNSPSCALYDRAGNLLISDAGNNRIRRVSATSGIISTIAGTGAYGNCTDSGVPASLWKGSPLSLAIDGSGNTYVGCSYAVAKIDATTGFVSHVAGIGGPGPELGDGGPALQASLRYVYDLALDASGNLLVTDYGHNRVRRVSPAGLISTAAGGGSNGDGGPATAANLLTPGMPAHDAASSIVVPETNMYRIRMVTLTDGRISTIAGNGEPTNDGDGGPATLASFQNPVATAFDAQGNIYISSGGVIRRIDRKSGIIRTFAGRTDGDRVTLGDGGPASNAFFAAPQGLAFDKTGNLYIADRCNARIRRISGFTGTVITIAGSTPTPVTNCGASDFSGDGGPATLARLAGPVAVAVDDDANVFVADSLNRRIRRIDGATGVITTVAGGGSTPLRDGVAATEALIIPSSVAVDSRGSVYFSQNRGGGGDGGIFAVDKRSTTIRLVAGGPVRGFGGDGGPATSASISAPNYVTLDDNDNLYISDSFNNRLRAVYACRSVTGPGLTLPADGALDLASADLSWSAPAGAFRYDVLLDVVNPPARVVASDLVATSFSASNLAPGTKHYWQIVARGDPYCTPRASGASAVRSFTTSSTCQPPAAFTQSAPADGATGIPSGASLTWSASAGASRYEIYLGTTNPPPLAGTSTSSSFAATLAPGATYYWTVRARAACDESLSTSTTIRSFKTTGACATPGTFTTSSPVNGATGLPASLTLSWTASSGAASYDLYLGTTSDPPLHAPAIPRTSIDVTGLTPGREYRWRIVAKAACDPTKTATTAIATLTTASDCPAPGATTISFTPPGSIGLGRTYSIAWRAAAGLEPDGEYLVERSQDASFASAVESQTVSGTTAAFVASLTGAWHHRVSAIADCDPSRRGPPSTAARVTVVDANPNVVFTVQPPPAFSPVGGKMEDQRSSFTIENISDSTLQVLLGKAEIDSVPFFTVVNPEGGDSVFVSLAPHAPKRMELRFSGPPNDHDGAYQGLLIASTANSPIIPYAFVNLKVGAGAGTAPRIRSGGVPTEYASFPGLDGDDKGRAPIAIEIENPGTTAMDVACEIGPEVWLVPEAGWNATAIPAGAMRTVRLYTRRVQAPDNSALPRYTYFTVRTREGASARLLVQDNGAGSVVPGRLALGPGERSLIVPNVVSSTAERRVSRIRLSNVSTEKVAATLIFTPQGADGFDQKAVRSAAVIVPPNDVVTLTDPLVQLFGFAPPASGQCEIAAADGRLGFLGVSSDIVSANDPSLYRAEVPVLRRGDGAAQETPHVVPGVTETASELTTLRLVETTGTDVAQVRLTLYDSEGTARGQDSYTVPRYGRVNLGRVVSALAGSATIAAGRIEVEVTSGSGHVMGVATISDPGDRGGTTILGRPTGGSGATRAQARAARRALKSTSASGSVSLAIPVVSSSSSTGVSYRTLLGLLASKMLDTVFTLQFHGGGGSTITKTVSLPAGRSIEFPDVLPGLFGLTSAAQGSILVQVVPSGGDVYTRLVYTSPTALAVPVTGLPVVSTGSLGLASATGDERRPLFLDGLEQSTDASRGTSWSLYVSELRGGSGTVLVSLYEAGNRSVPVAKKSFTIGALGQLRLETVFAALGLDDDDRRKDRTNVLVSLIPTSGTALVGACAVSVDNRSGIATTHLLTPAGRLPASPGALAAPIETPVRKRPVRR